MNTPLSIWQPVGLTGVETHHQAGAWTASHLLTNDAEQSSSFYEAVFGWTEHEWQFRIAQSSVATVALHYATTTPSPHWLTIFATDSLTDTLQRVSKAGGTTMGTVRVGNGTVNIVTDSQSTVFGITPTKQGR
jgi:predicted enzyme related to lactoylglutathione lyase